MFRPGWLRTCSDNRDLPISGYANVPSSWIEGESPCFRAVLHGLALPGSRQGHPEGTRVEAAASPSAHPWSHHPLFVELLARPGFGASENTPELAAPRAWHWFGATMVYLGPRWTRCLRRGSAVAGLGAAPAWVCSSVLDVKWLS